MRTALIVGALWLAAAAFVVRWVTVAVGAPRPGARAPVQHPPKPPSAVGRKSINEAVAEALDDVDHVLGSEDRPADDRRLHGILRSRVGKQPRSIR